MQPLICCGSYNYSDSAMILEFAGNDLAKVLLAACCARLHISNNSITKVMLF